MHTLINPTKKQTPNFLSKKQQCNGDMKRIISQYNIIHKYYDIVLVPSIL